MKELIKYILANEDKYIGQPEEPLFNISVQIHAVGSELENIKSLPGNVDFKISSERTHMSVEYYPTNTKDTFEIIDYIRQLIASKSKLKIIFDEPDKDCTCEDHIDIIFVEILHFEICVEKSPHYIYLNLKILPSQILSLTKWRLNATTT